MLGDAQPTVESGLEKFGEVPISAKNQNPLQEKNDLVLEFDLYLPNHERTQNITFHAAAIISRKEVPPTYLIYEASIRKALVLSAKRFITFLHLCP
nr:unnamed protein product [Haemonchus contortus]